MIEYDEKYYNNIIKKYKYKHIKGFISLSNEEASRRWISSYNLSTFIDGYNNKERTLVLMGLGINTTPHLGTIMQILNIIYLQKKGFKVQIILGDLDVYGARNIDIDNVKRIIKKYKKLIVGLGFDIKKGVIRTQFEREDINQTAYIISKYINDEDFYEIEEDINNLYNKEKVYDGMSFSVKQSITLMFADFIHPIYKEKYKRVLVLSGIDEHGYAWKANQICRRMNLNGSISSMHTKMIHGMNSYPKMSKSINKSVIDLDIKNSELKKIFNNDDNNELILQLMINVSNYNEIELERIIMEYKINSYKWQEEKKKYYIYLYRFIKLWR